MENTTVKKPHFMKMKFVNIIFFIAMLLVNALANLLPMGGNTTGEVSARYPSLFTPAGYTFSIWGLIYLLLAIVFFYLLVSRPSRVTIDLESALGLWFILSCVFNICWIFSWHYNQIGLSLVFIMVLWGCLLKVNWNLDKCDPASLLEHLTIFAFQIYLGWISAATLANLNIFFAKIGWTTLHLPKQFFTIFSIFLGVLIAEAYLLKGKRPYTTFVFIWTYIGILVKHLSKSGFDRVYPITIVSLVLAIISLLILIRVQRME